MNPHTLRSELTTALKSAEPRSKRATELAYQLRKTTNECLEEEVMNEIVDLSAYNPLPRIEMPSPEDRRREAIEAYRRVAADGIDHIIDRLPQDMERLCKNIARLLEDCDPRVTGDELKFVDDAELIIKEQLNAALLQIALLKGRYRKKLALAEGARSILSEVEIDLALQIAHDEFCKVGAAE